MPSIINTTISNINNYYDVNKQLLPPGNYYFKIKKYRNDVFKGEISMGSKGSYGNFNIKAVDLVKMMAVAQSRLGRRMKDGGIKEPGFPQYSSPSNSPKNEQTSKSSNIRESSNIKDIKENTIIRNSVINSVRNSVINSVKNSVRNTEKSNTDYTNITHNDKLINQYLGIDNSNKKDTHSITNKKDFSKENKIKENECSICLDKIDKADKKILSCSHSFHWKCIKKWYIKHKTCPICRKIGERHDKMRCYNYNIERKSFVLKY